MKRFIFYLILVLVSCVSGFAQSNCPTIKLIIPDGYAKISDPIMVSVVLEELPENSEIEYEWKISSGEIIAGQGTYVIRFQPSRDAEVIKVEIKIKGFPKTCVNTELDFIPIAPRLVCNGPIVAYQKAEINKEYSVIDSLGIELINDSKVKAFIIIEIEKNETVEQTKKHIQKLVKFIKYRKYPKERIIFAIKRAETHYTKMYLFSEETDFPECENCEIVKGIDL